MAKMNHERLKHLGKPRISLIKPKPIKGPHTNIKRQPVKIYSPKEIMEFANAHSGACAPGILGKWNI